MVRSLPFPRQALNQVLLLVQHCQLARDSLPLLLARTQGQGQALGLRPATPLASPSVPPPSLKPLPNPLGPGLLALGLGLMAMDWGQEASLQ